MKLHRGCDVLPDEGAGLVCRQSRLGGLILAVLYTIVLAALPVVVWRFGGPWVFAVVGCVMAALFLPFMFADVRLRFRESNWLLWMRRDSLWINLRSYQHRSPGELPSVLELGSSDVSEVRRYQETFVIPNSEGRATEHKLESLEIELRQAETNELAAALATLRRHVQSGIQVTLQSVSLPLPNMIRIAWYGGQGHGVTPRLGRVLEALAGQFRIGTETSLKNDLRQVSDTDLDSGILSLVESGNKIDAIKVLVGRRGFSLADAKQFVDDLSAGRDR